MNKIVENINIGTLGILDVNLPKITFQGRNPGPKIVLIAGQHGKETSPLLVINELVKKLSSTPLVAGAISILPVANPLGLVFGSRQEPLDGDDLNRSAPGSKNKNFSKRLAGALFENCQGADLVIDLHCFNRQALYTGVLIKEPVTYEKSASAIKALAPEIVWQIDLDRTDDRRFVGSLGILLVEQGVPAITLEMPRSASITVTEVSKIVSGMMNLLAVYKMIGGPSSVGYKEILIYNGVYLYFNESGIFTSSKKNMSEIKMGEKLGELTSLKDLSVRDVVSPESGTILTLAFNDFVRSGSKLGSIGKKVGVL